VIGPIKSQLLQIICFKLKVVLSSSTYSHVAPNSKYKFYLLMLDVLDTKRSRAATGVYMNY